MWLHKVDDQGKMVKNHSWQNKSKHYVSRCLLLLSKSLLQTQSSHWHSRCDRLSWSPWRANSKLNKSSVCPSCECFKDSKLPCLLAGCWLVVLWHQTRLSLHNHEVLKWTKNTKTHCGKQHSRALQVDHSMIAEPDDPSCLDPGPRWQMVPGPKWRPWCHTKCHFIDCLPRCDYCILLWLRVKTWFVKSKHPGILRKRLQPAPWKSQRQSRLSRDTSYRFQKSWASNYRFQSLNLLSVAISVDENNLGIWERVGQSSLGNLRKFKPTQLTQLCFSIVAAWILALSVWSVPQQQHLSQKNQKNKALNGRCSLQMLGGLGSRRKHVSLGTFPTLLSVRARRRRLQSNII